MLFAHFSLCSFIRFKLIVMAFLFLTRFFKKNALSLLPQSSGGPFSTRYIYCCCILGILFLTIFSVGLLLFHQHSLNNNGSGAFSILNAIRPSCLLPFNSYIELHEELARSRTLSATVLPKSVLVLITATGSYYQLALNLVDSARRHFCLDNEKTTTGCGACSNVTYLIFTDAEKSSSVLIGDKAEQNQYIQIVQEPLLGWPQDTLKRYHIYLKQLTLIKSFDFILALDADLRFVSDVRLADIYGDLVATLHPGFVTTSRWMLPFERRHPRSKAYVGLLSGCRYFTGAIWGGRSAPFVRALRTLVWLIDSDTQVFGVNFTAAWQDESYLNRYLIDNPPTRVLSPSYYYPENDGDYPAIQQLTRKIVSIEKDSKLLRS